ncbi:LysR substrate-binding domain-containing protein [uncultured Hydrogenophaga sp.]|uniref:LysR substrate-binding domain-containing protein n=1 Tax=uncultured Hydrogenophaga sp. TaxID=199683 RepID=UPI00258272F0|nr:LysR substrate-binding domain-containing protein [uncultured Hydrogenophaga sp.]
MDIKQLRYFVMVAEELSFSKAAARLHMSQPPLSQQIKALEEEMGVELFARNRREVKLTESGHVFLRESRVLLDQFRTAVNMAINASRENVGTLRLGVATSGLFSVLPTLLSLIRSEYPNVDVQLSDMQSEAQIQALSQGMLDLGIVHVSPQKLGLARHPVHSENLSLVLPASHRLAASRVVPLAEVADEPVVALSRTHAPTVFDAAIACCAEAGFSPLIKHTARSPFTIFQMVRMGFGIALVPRSYRFGDYPGVVFHDLPVSDLGRIRMELVWDERRGNSLARTLAQHLAPRLAEALGTLRPLAP